MAPNLPEWVNLQIKIFPNYCFLSSKMFFFALLFILLRTVQVCLLFYRHVQWFSTLSIIFFWCPTIEDFLYFPIPKGKLPIVMKLHVNWESLANIKNSSCAYTHIGDRPC